MSVPVCRSGFPLWSWSQSWASGSFCWITAAYTFTVEQWKVIVFDPRPLLTPADLIDGTDQTGILQITMSLLNGSLWMFKCVVTSHISLALAPCIIFRNAALSNKDIAVHIFLNYETFGKNLTTYCYFQCHLLSNNHIRLWILGLEMRHKYRILKEM